MTPNIDYSNHYSDRNHGGELDVITFDVRELNYLPNSANLEATQYFSKFYSHHSSRYPGFGITLIASQEE